MSLDVSALFSAVVSEAQTLGVFAEVRQHEPKNAPTVNGLTCALWWAGTKTIRSSGLASVSAMVSFRGRVYSNMLAEPQDGIDPELMSAAHLLIGQYAGAFTLGGTARMVDLLGSEGEVLAAEPGYISHDSRVFRVAELAIPIVINDLWTEAP